jgi:hypothetical protein
LEFALRAFLYEHNKDREPEVKLDSLNECDRVEVNSLTNYDTLGILVDKFNEIVLHKHPEALLDRKLVVDLRDALVHGRIFILDPTVTVSNTLLKFDVPVDGNVHVSMKVVMDKPWFKAKVRFLIEQVKKVVSGSRSMGMNIF